MKACWYIYLAGLLEYNPSRSLGFVHTMQYNTRTHMLQYHVVKKMTISLGFSGCGNTWPLWLITHSHTFQGKRETLWEREKERNPTPADHMLSDWRECFDDSFLNKPCSHKIVFLIVGRQYLWRHSELSYDPSSQVFCPALFDHAWSSNTLHPISQTLGAELA